MITLSQMLSSAARDDPEREAVVHRSKRTSYGELDRRTTSFARGLAALGVQPGDRIVLLMQNCVEWNVVLFACSRIGAVLVPCNTRFREIEIDQIIRSARPSILIASDLLSARRIEVNSVLPSTAIDPAARATEYPYLQNVIVLGEQIPAWARSFDEVEAMGAAEGGSIAGAVREDEVAQIVFTSGTTGKPKGCMLSNRSLYEKCRLRSGLLPWTSSDRALVTAPYFTIAGSLGAIVANCYKRSTQVLVDRVKAEEILPLIQAENVTLISGVPTMYLSLKDHPHRTEFDLSSLRYAMIGSAPIPESLIDFLIDQKRGLGLRVVVTYGLTEAGGITHHTSLDDSAETIRTTVGRTAGGVECRIVDTATSKDVAPGKSGEVIVRGSGLMSGYFEDPVGTAARLRGGWLWTGDVGWEDGHGRLHLSGRSSEMLIVGGFNIHPSEIENYIMTHPRVRLAAVIGMPDDRLGEVPAAFVVSDDDRLSADDLSSFLMTRVARYKIPRSFHFLRSLPMTSFGKIDKISLRERLPAAAGQAPSSPQFSEKDWIELNHALGEEPFSISDRRN